ncbi:MAG: T9SS type A sorting domain-containing protein [Bacteroidales bacterium]|nr:T9SS type A sorting domain-containing protein [Bacteroidales bacterium]
MKNKFTNTLILFISGLLIFSTVKAAEVLLWDDVVTYTTDYTVTPSGFIYTYDMSTTPSNMVSPYNYRDGQIYLRYEIISQPTNSSGGYTPIYFSWAVWADWAPPYWTESASPISVSLSGPGSVAANNSSPNSWWTKNGGVNWSNTSTFHHYGLIAWVSMQSTQVLLSPSGYSTNPLSHEAWAIRSQHWFPMQVRITVVAVSAGSTFLGWDNYVSGGTPPPPPPPPPPGCGEIEESPAPSANAIQGEDMTFDNYFIQSIASASGDEVAGMYDFSTLTGYNEGSLSTTFPHSDGIYDIKVVYIDENDGAASFDLKINGTSIDTWSGVERECEQFSTRTFSDVAIYNGNIISIDGTRGDEAYAKVDYIDFIYKGEIIVDPPSFTIDYINEETNETVTSGYEYSYNQTDWITGPNTNLALTPGQDVYFRETGDVDVQHLTVENRPATPAFSIDYIAEETTENVSSNYQYSVNSNMSGAVTGTGSPIDITPGQDLYFKRLATSSSFASGIQSLDIPNRPSSPSFSINYDNETTIETVSSTIDYSVNSNMSSAQTGGNVTVNVTPGIDLYFRYKATGSSFASNIFSLDVPARPASPSFSINFINETTNEVVSSSIEMSANSSFTSPQLGEGSVVTVIPGECLYFRTLPGVSVFRSASFELSAQERPTLSNYSVNFYNRTTQQTIPSGVFYSLNSDMSDASEGAGSVIPVTPGTDLYLNKPATESSFASDIFQLDVPALPQLSSDDEVDGEINGLPITVNLTFDGSINGLAISDLTLTNATASNLQEGYTFNVHPLSEGHVSVYLPTNSVDNGNFQSEVYIFNYSGPLTGLPYSSADEIVVYPNPSKGILNYNIDYNNAIQIQIIDSRGQIVHSELTDNSEGIIDIQKMSNGLYIVKFLNANGLIATHRIVLSQ